ncbi:MAG: hypothetical protein IPK25_19220 [Saprospiraceae bacterium]|nr:hypothetical protein [Saprospiraceae bacterium]
MPAPEVYFFNGASAAVALGTTTISNNLVGDQVVDNTAGTPPFTTPTTTVYTKGIFVAGATNVQVTKQHTENILSYVGTAMNAIELSSAITNST